jgi:hypothetical protein
VRLDALMLATVEPLQAAESLAVELRGWRNQPPRHPAVAEAAGRGASQCRAAAGRLRVLANELEQIEKEASR